LAFLIDQQKEDRMKFPSISLMAGGLLFVATSVLAADTTTTSPSTTGPSGFMSPQGLPPSTPEESTGRPLGSLPNQVQTMPGGTQVLPSSPGTSSEAPTSPGAALPPPAGGG
jgi:hypothetical protein